MRRTALTAKLDTNKIKLLLALGDSLHDREAKAALDYATEALDLANKLHWHPLTGRIEEMIGYTNNHLSNYAEALVHYDRCIQLYLADGDSLNAASVHWYISTTYGHVADTARALEHMHLYLDLALHAGDTAIIIEAYRGLGSTYRALDPDRAMTYCQEALGLALLARDSDQVCLARAQIGALWNTKGDTHRAVVEMEQALVMAKSLRNSWLEFMNSWTLAGVLDNIGRGAEADSLRDEALRLAERIGDKRNMSLIHRIIGWRQYTHGKSAQARKHFRASLALAKQRKMLVEETEAIEGLMRTHLKDGRADSATIYLDVYIRNKDSLEQLDQRMELGRWTARMDYRSKQVEDSLLHAGEISRVEKDRTIERLRADRNRNRAMVFGGVALLLALIALLLYRSMRTRQHLAQKEKELHGEQVDQLLSQQEIKSINAMLEGQEKERDRVAKDLHDRLGSMLGGIKAQLGALEDRVEQVQHDAQFQKVHRLLDETVGELRQISHDMAASTLSRFGLEKALKDLRDTIHISGRLSVELSVFGLEQRLERSVEIAVYRIIQELVSNVLKHAKARELSIDVTRSPGRLSVIVSDNGLGFDTTKPAEGMGLGNVRSRAASLGGKVQVDSSPGVGTTVSVECPVVE